MTSELKASSLLADSGKFDELAQAERTLRTSSAMLEAIRAIDSGSDLRPSESIELLRVAVEALNKVCSSGNDYHEWTEELDGLCSAAVGQIILKALPGDGAPVAPRWTAAQKTFWIEVAEELGPDWIETFRSVGAFLKRVEGF